MLENDTIEVLGARVHNLKNIDVSIPREKLVVITGLSGSVKASLCRNFFGLCSSISWWLGASRC